MSENPYQSPQADTRKPPVKMAPPAAAQAYAGPWRHGKLMVVNKLAEFPDICLVSNLPAEGSRLQRKFSWHHPLIALSILIAVPVYLVLAIVLSKRATLHVPMTRQWIIRRRWRIAVAWLVGLSSIALFIGAIVLDDNGVDLGAWLFLASIFLFLGAVFFGIIACPLIKPARISDQFVWLRGVHPDYLAQLPEWQYGYLA